MKKHVVGALALAALLLVQLSPLHAEAAPKPLKVFILSGQSNMDGQANVSTIDFLGEDKEHGYLLKTLKPDDNTLVTRGDVWVAHRGLVAYVHDTLDNLKKRFPEYDEKAGYEIAGFADQLPRTQTQPMAQQT